MSRFRLSLNALVAVCSILAFTSLAQAQAIRTWVSGVGDDFNPCSRTAPCKTFAGAISKTATGGEINTIDAGGFGAVTITKAMTIDGGDGALASILHSSTNGVVVNAPATATVTLRNLSIQGARQGTLPGLNGVRFLAGSVLNVENCVIQNSNNFGIDFVPSTQAFLHVKDTIIRNMLGGGVNIVPVGVTARALLDHVQVENNTFGIKAGNNAIVTVNRSEVSANGADAGFLADGATAVMNIESSVASINSIGVRARNSATIRLSNVTVVNNIGAGLLAELSGQIISFQQNRIAGNSPNNAPTSTLNQQ